MMDGQVDDAMGMVDEMEKHIYGNSICYGILWNFVQTVLFKLLIQRFQNCFQITVISLCMQYFFFSK